MRNRSLKGAICRDIASSYFLDGIVKKLPLKVRRRAGGTDHKVKKLHVAKDSHWHFRQLRDRDRVST
jgi:hypothetical protein